MNAMIKMNNSISLPISVPLPIPISLSLPIPIRAHDAENAVAEYAADEYPNECCGMILKSKNEKGAIRIRPCVNAQDKYHRLDPENFPRSARNAYFIEPSELFEIDRELRQRGERIAIIYHSHPDADAYFSEEDIRQAAPEGIPLYPDVGYLVISVMGGKVVKGKIFCWDSEQSTFVEKDQKVLYELYDL